MLYTKGRQKKRYPPHHENSLTSATYLPTSKHVTDTSCCPPVTVNVQLLHRSSGNLVCVAGRPRGGEVGRTSGAPRCPEVPGCFLGALPGWPPPRAGRAGGAARGGGQGKRKKKIRFYDFWSFLANFCLFVSDFAWFGSVFPKFSRFFPRCVPRCVPTSGDRRVAVPEVIATSGATPAGAPEVRPTPPLPGVVVRRT